jgi:2-phosphosulfolactate phosphatase
MIQIELFFTPTDVRNRLIPRSTSIVIDVLRFCTSVCFALNSGCKGVYTVLTTTEAHKLKNKLKSKKVLLCGERLGQKIKEFDLGNSPQEYTKSAVKDHYLIFTTTNGTRAIDQVKKAKELIISTFANLNTVMKYLKKKRDSLLMFVCSGRTGYFSLEDTICAGAIIQSLTDFYTRLSINYRISDTAAASMRLYLEYKDDLLGMLHISDHGRYLIGIGSEEDLKYCAEIDSNKVIPVYNKVKGMFTRLNYD